MMLMELTGDQMKWQNVARMLAASLSFGLQNIITQNKKSDILSKFMRDEALKNNNILVWKIFNL